ncbi:MAG TPA: hypothetical protein DCQ93_00960, partial [Bacteroidetes bacterium]|nr:hypothetical protein [Bacteroidota bacterium]
MKVALYSRQLNVRHAVFIQKLLLSLHRRGFETLVHAPYYNQLREHLEVPDSLSIFKSHLDLNGRAECMFSL